MKFYSIQYIYLILLFGLVACKPKTKKTTNNYKALSYAKGFVYKKYKNHTELTVLKPFKGATKPLTYFLITGDTIVKPKDENQIVIKTPVQKIIATSTTQIPVLEALKAEKLLKGYPNTTFISSKKTRYLIDNHQIIDIGHETNMNSELVLQLQPDVLFAFAVNKLNKNHITLKKAGIPIVIDASWLEETPLGRAEWIKFFALFLNKEKEANLVFKQIETDYNNAKVLVNKVKNKPSVLYGSMYNGVWYAPAGNSFIAQILKDAKTDYVWKTTQGTGSLSLPFEQVFIKAQHTNFWLSPGYANTKSTLNNNNKHYHQFAAFKNNNVYTHTNTTGPTGGLLFFELGALRPDLILKDIVKICHPKALPNYENTFFKVLD